MYMRICNAESQKRSAQGSHYKEDDRDLPLYKFLLFGVHPIFIFLTARNVHKISRNVLNGILWEP